MMHWDLLILLLRVCTTVHATKAWSLPACTIFLYLRWLEIAESATIDEAPGDGKKCGSIEYVQGEMRQTFLFIAIVLVALTGLLAGLALVMMRVDLARLNIWTEIGEAKQKCAPYFLFSSQPKRLNSGSMWH